MRPVKWGWIARRATVSAALLVAATSAVGATLAYHAVSASQAALPAASPAPAPTPPPPSFTANGTPDDPTFATSATFIYTDSQSGVSYRCHLDQAAYAACGSKSQSYTNLALGTHTFYLEACNAAGNCSTPLTYTWTILVRKSFAVNGNAVGSFYPGGPAVPIDLVIANPFTFTLEVTSVTVTVDGTSVAGCGASNFTVVQGLAAKVDIPAGQTLSLDAAGVPQASWPQVRMLDTLVNQDVCKGATVSFSFAGQGTKAQ